MGDQPKRPFEDWNDVISWATGAADTVRSILKEKSIELFADFGSEIKFLGSASVVLDIIHEYRTHPHDSLSILGDTGSIEGKLFLTAVAPWLTIAALIIDPFVLHPLHRQGIMDVAGEMGRTAVQQFLRQFPRDMDALAWLVRFASQSSHPPSPPSQFGQLPMSAHMPHPNSPAGRHFDWSPLGVPHPHSPAGRNFDYGSTLSIVHPNSPAGRGQLGGSRVSRGLPFSPVHRGSRNSGPARLSPPSGLTVEAVEDPRLGTKILVTKQPSSAEPTLLTDAVVERPSNAAEDIECFQPRLDKPDQSKVFKTMDRKEFERAVKMAQDEVNQLSPDEFLERLNELDPQQLGKGARAIRNEASNIAAHKEALKKWKEISQNDMPKAVPHLAQVLLDDEEYSKLPLSPEEAMASVERENDPARLDMMHRADIGGGGDAKRFGGPGDSSINRSIGGQWTKSKLSALRKKAEKAKREGKQKMDVEFNVCPEKKTP